jgi:uncharacterized RDD family membrane protein YckC
VPTGTPHDGYAGVVSRLAALVLDVAIVTLLAAGIVALAIGGAEVMLGRVPRWVEVPTVLAVALLPVAYFTTAWWLTGQSLGGIAMGIAVRDARVRSLGFPRSLIRAAAGLALAPVWLVGMCLILVDGRRRGLLDLLVGTVVVYAPDRRADGSRDDASFTPAG